MTDNDRTRDDGRVWGHIENGVFRRLDKQKLLDAGYTEPPFDIEIRGGVVRQVVHQPETPEPPGAVPSPERTASRTPGG